MAKVPLTADHVRTGKFVLNAESVGISPEQFSDFVATIPNFVSSTAQKEIIVMSPTNSKTAC